MLNNRIPILFLKQQERESSENNWGKNNINGFSNNAKIISYCVEINIYFKLLIFTCYPSTTSLTLPHFIEVPVQSQESERPCICVHVLAILTMSTDPQTQDQ